MQDQISMSITGLSTESSVPKLAGDQPSPWRPEQNKSQKKGVSLSFSLAVHVRCLLMGLKLLALLALRSEH